MISVFQTRRITMLELLKFWIMKKRLQLIFPILTIVVMCSFVADRLSWDVPAEFKNMKNPVAKTEKALAEGKTKYSHSCAGCHGLTGKGDGEKVKNLVNIKPASLVGEQSLKDTDGERFYKIKYGRGGNHSFSGKLDDETIWSIILYTRTFSAK